MIKQEPGAVPEPEPEPEPVAVVSPVTVVSPVALWCDDKGRQKAITTVTIHLPFSVPPGVVVEAIDLSSRSPILLPSVDCYLYDSPTYEPNERQRQREEYEKYFKYLCSSTRQVQKCARIRLPHMPATLYLVGPSKERIDSFTANDPVQCYYKMDVIPGNSSPTQRRQPHLPMGVPPPPSASTYTAAPSPSATYTASPYHIYGTGGPYPPWPTQPHPPPSSSVPSQQPIRPDPTPARAMVSKTFLRDLTHQHDWVLGAISELIHNARDAFAKKITISIRYDHNQKPMFVIDDDGLGMSHEDINRMLSFGHDEQRDAESTETRIGKFGFGFKHGSMRIGDDAIVLTKSDRSFSIGFLSQSYNNTQDEVRVPIITRHYPGLKLDLSVNDEHKAQIAEQAIRQHSPFNQYTLNRELATMGNPTGTRVIIYNLRKIRRDDMNDFTESKQQQKSTMNCNDDEDYELKWCSYPNDIRIILSDQLNMRARPGQLSTDVPLDYSLRAYCEMMFLDRQCSIELQDKNVILPFNPDKQLTSVHTYVCDTLTKFKGLKLILGYSELEKERGNCGIHLYWHKTLIESYTRVGVQLTSDKALGCIGVFDVGQQLLPKNTKQGFPTSSSLYPALLKWLAESLNNFIYEVLKIDVIDVDPLADKLTVDWQWVQCDKCDKWRRVTSEEYQKIQTLNKWYCYMNKDTAYNRCEIPQDKHYEAAGEKEVVVDVSHGGRRQSSRSRLSPPSPSPSSASTSVSSKLKRSREGGEKDIDEQKTKEIKQNGDPIISQRRHANTINGRISIPHPHRERSHLSTIPLSQLYPNPQIPSRTLPTSSSPAGTTSNTNHHPPINPQPRPSQSIDAIGDHRPSSSSSSRSSSSSSSLARPQPPSRSFSSSSSSTSTSFSNPLASKLKNFNFDDRDGSDSD